MISSVLVVDDDPNLVRLMSRFLTLEGFAPVPAANGAEALTYLRGGGSASVSLLDLRMPVMDGWEFRRERRSGRLSGHGSCCVVPQAGQFSRNRRGRPPPVRGARQLARSPKPHLFSSNAAEMTNGLLGRIDRALRENIPLPALASAVAEAEVADPGGSEGRD